jgi:rfaE bifunctional protein kinase chain/domain
MDKKRLEQILARLPDIRLVVYGDYFLDNYLILERRLSETSLETGLEAYQVVDTHKHPGVAGTTVSNLRSLGVNVFALGLYGDDGNGFELRKKLVENKVDVRGFLEVPGFNTPTYNKPMMREADGQEHELNRLDIKYRASLEPSLEDRLIEQMHSLLAEADGMLIIDQARQRNCGVVTDRMRDEIHMLGMANTKKVILADSREYLGLFKFGILKSNLSEALRSANVKRKADESTPACAERCGRLLNAQTGCPAIITLGGEGMYLIQDSHHDSIFIPGIPVEGPIDIVGAGDAVDASIGAALCAGATLEEAGFFANLVASIVIQQIGVTGTASPQQVMDQYLRHFEA